MTLVKQKIFKEKYVEELRSKVRSCNGLEDYLSEDVDNPKEAVWETGILVDEDKSKLKILPSGNQASADLDNSITIYEAYNNINETQASDPRLWTYLTHSTYRQYTLARWGIEMKDSDLESSQSDQDFILAHWFVSGNDRSLRRNALSRLWWAAHLTALPWEKDPVFFEGSGVDTKDPYKYTRILFSTQDVFQQVLERGLGRDRKILIPILDYIREHAPLTREQIREIVKELNLILSVRNIAMLNFEELKTLIKEIALPTP